MIRSALYRLRMWLRRNTAETELHDELHFHFDHLVEQNLEQGMSPAEASRQARLVLGGLEQWKEECRDERGVRPIENLCQDAGYAMRLLRKQPGFALAVISILALSIGATTAVFSAVDNTLLKPLPFADAGRLAVLTEENPVAHIDRTGAPYLDYQAWAKQSNSFSHMAAYWNVSGDGLVFNGASSPEHVRYSIITRNFFPVLGISPVVGRSFTPEEELAGASKVFLVSHALWQRSMGSRTNAIGTTFRLDGQPYTLIGVLPPGLEFPQHCDIWLPTGVLTPQQMADRVSHPFWALGRLKPGVSLAQSRQELSLISNRLSKALPGSNANWQTRVSPLTDEYVGDTRQSLLALLGAVLFTLLIACASVAMLLLARAEGRQKEFAVRAALGASRTRLVMQGLIESLVISTLSTVAGLFVGHWALRLIVGLSAGTLPRNQDFSLDGSMLVFSSMLVCAISVLIGIISAWQLAVCNSLGERSPSSVGPASQRFRQLLVIAEVAMTVCLLCGAGLMLSSFRQLRHVDPGFQPEHLVTMRISLPDADYSNVQQRTQLLTQLLGRLRTVPDVRSVGATSHLPLSGDNNWQSISLENHPTREWTQAPSVETRSVSAGYFRAMGTPFLQGEDFREIVESRRSCTVIINQRMAEKLWPGANAMGKRITTVDEPDHWREVIGVVANVKHFGLAADNDPEMYLPYGWWSSMSLVLRTGSDTKQLLETVRNEVRRLDSGIPVYQVASMDALVRQSLGSQRLDLSLMMCFAGLALCLAVVGIHGLLAFQVNSRQREFGIRLALGASYGGILQSVIWGGLKLVVVGLAIGLVASLALTRLLAGLLYHVSASDPLTFAAVLLLLGAVATVACWWPARRAARVDPNVALRAE